MFKKVAFKKMVACAMCIIMVVSALAILPAETLADDIAYVEVPAQEETEDSYTGYQDYPTYENYLAYVDPPTYADYPTYVDMPTADSPTYKGEPVIDYPTYEDELIADEPTYADTAVYAYVTNPEMFGVGIQPFGSNATATISVETYRPSPGDYVYIIISFVSISPGYGMYALQFYLLYNSHYLDRCSANFHASTGPNISVGPQNIGANPETGRLAIIIDDADGIFARRLLYGPYFAMNISDSRELARFRFRVLDSSLDDGTPLVRLNPLLIEGFILNASGNPIAHAEIGLGSGNIDVNVIGRPSLVVFPVTVAPVVYDYVDVSPQMAAVGTQVTVTINPPAGQRLANNGVIVDGVAVTSAAGSTQVTFIKTVDETIVSAQFEAAPIPYAVTVAGTVMNYVSIGLVTTATVGQEITVTITPPTGQRLAVNGVTVDGIAVTSAAGVGSVTFTKTSGNTVVSATFEPIPPSQHSITVTTQGNGTAVANMLSTTPGMVVTLTATPAAGHQFAGWQVISGGVILSGTMAATTTFIMPNNNVVVRANFVPVFVPQPDESYEPYVPSAPPVQAPLRPTIPANNAAVRVPIRVMDNQLTIFNAMAMQLVNSAIDYTVSFDLSEVENATAITLPRSAMRQFAVAELAVQFQLPYSTITFDACAVMSLWQQARSSNVSIRIMPVAYSQLSDLQKDAVAPEFALYRLVIMSGTQTITDFDGIITVTLPFEGTSPVVWSLSENGEKRRLEVGFDAEMGAITFAITNLCVIVVADVELPIQYTLRLAIGSIVFSHYGISQVNDVAPFIDPMYDRTMVPIRIIAEALNAHVYFCGYTHTVYITMVSGETLTLPVNVPLPYGMGTPVIVNDRTFVPVRYVSEILGATVRWCEENRAVYIYR